MRNIILAFGLLLLPVVTMAAPPQPCKITIDIKGTITAQGCTATERKLVMAAQAKPTVKQVAAGLQKLEGKQYLAINYLCKFKRGRRKAPRSLVERCYRRAGEGQRLILRNALNNLQDIKACRGIKSLGQQVNCMIDQNNRLLLPLIERTLDTHEAYMRGLKFMINHHGCHLKGGKVKCAGFSPVGAVLFLITLLSSRRSDRKEWFDFQALGYLEARNWVWAIEDELYKARWVERLIEAAITLTALSLGGLVLGIASAFLAHKRYGWASIFALFLSVLFWGSSLEWIMFVVKAIMSFLANTEEGFEFLRHLGYWRWKRQVAKLK